MWKPLSIVTCELKVKGRDEVREESYIPEQAGRCVDRAFLP